MRGDEIGHPDPWNVVMSVKREVVKAPLYINWYSP